MELYLPIVYFKDISIVVCFCICTFPFIYAVHGFLNAYYDVLEGERLDTVFELNVKGEASQAPRIRGKVSVEAGTARESSVH